jgi:hypothetical protein
VAAPVINDDSSLATNTARLATSEGAALPRIGVRSVTPTISGPRLWVIRVSIAPGQMVVTRIPLAAYSAAAAFVIIRTAPLAAQ